VSTKRVHISLPTALVAKIDRLAHAEKINRSQFIQNIVQLYIMEREAQSLPDKMRVGYQIMAELNLLLAEEGTDEDLLENYERQLAEAE